jgi:tetratricopeptide (TPR) repeat protein
MEEAVASYKRMDDDKKTPYGAFHLARGLEILGGFKGDVTVVRDAITHYISIRQEATNSGYAAAYFAEIEKALGNCYSFLREYDKAIQHYQASLRYEDSDLTKVFLARAQVNFGDIVRARETLLSIDLSGFNEHAHFDYSISWAILAARSLTEEDLEVAKSNLKNAKSFWPIFISQRDSALIDLLETSPRKTEGRFKSLIRALNRYVSLNPNVFGIGIDFNKIVEDIHDKETRNCPIRLIQQTQKAAPLISGVRGLKEYNAE